MNGTERTLVEHWTVDYGDGCAPEYITVPHSWNQDVCLDFEGPVVYRTSIEVPPRATKLVFGGVSYAAEVALAGRIVCRHEGIWDAFEVSLGDYAGRHVEVTVSVVKNGGKTYPVNQVASGFLPYLFHTFGGIYGHVSLVGHDEPLTKPIPLVCRADVSDSQILVDGNPFYVRGILHNGWYPEVGHPNPPTEVIRQEIQTIKQMGFNLVKFSLWVPSHRYLEILKEEGLEAWMELPVMRPTSNQAKLTQIADELERIVRQYRHHDNVIAWSVGSNLGAMTPEHRHHLAQLIRNLTGSPLVIIEHGEPQPSIYGSKLLGDFEDFHLSCDAQYYASALASILPGPRPAIPLLFGEFNEADVHRDLSRLGREIPFWCSTLSELNEQGVRLHNELPTILGHSRFAENMPSSGDSQLAISSVQKALFVRKSVQEIVRAQDRVSGYVVSGLRDTPISSSGFVDDWDEPRFSSSECRAWNERSCLFSIPSRQVRCHGGNHLPGVEDAFNQFTGNVSFRIGVHSEVPLRGGLVWRIFDSQSAQVARGASEIVDILSLRSLQVGEIAWHCKTPGLYRLEVEFVDVRNSWPFWISEPFSDEDRAFWSTDDPQGALGLASKSGAMVLSTRFTETLRPGLHILTGEGTSPKPFWQQSAYEFDGSYFWERIPFAERWERFLPISPDRVLEREWLDSLNTPYEVLMNRIDLADYRESPVLVKIGQSFITTLRLFGGLGAQPCGIPANAAGSDFVRGIGKMIISSGT